MRGARTKHSLQAPFLLVVVLAAALLTCRSSAASAPSSKPHFLPVDIHKALHQPTVVGKSFIHSVDWADDEGRAVQLQATAEQHDHVEVHNLDEVPKLESAALQKGKERSSAAMECKQAAQKSVYTCGANSDTCSAAACSWCAHDTSLLMLCFTVMHMLAEKCCEPPEIQSVHVEPICLCRATTIVFWIQLPGYLCLTILAHHCAGAIALTFADDKAAKAFSASITLDDIIVSGHSVHVNCEGKPCKEVRSF